jgi:hypothetical protein
MVRVMFLHRTSYEPESVGEISVEPSAQSDSKLMSVTFRD